LADTDADGLPDAEEAAYADTNDNDRKRSGFPSASSGFNWLGTVATSGAVNLLVQPGALYANTATDDGLVTAELPFPVRIGGLSVSNFAASVNGVAWLLAPGFSLPAGLFRQGADLGATTVSAHHITVAPCWGDLTAQPYGSDTNATSSITVAGVTYGGVDFNVIEWRNMGFKGWAFPANRHTFQLVIPAVPFADLYANALFARGLPTFSAGSGPANSATYGAQGPRAWQRHILCFNNVTPSYSAAAAYILGTGTDPLDPADRGPRDTQAISFSYGDPSGSHSEKYRLTVTPLSGDPCPAQRRLNRGYGEVESVSLVLIRGAKYTVTLSHVSTDPEYQDTPRPDYDYTLTISGSPSLLAEDPDGMLGSHNEGDFFYAAGKHATLALLKIETQTVATQPADRTRKTVGVGEEVNLTLLPPGLGLITWNIPSGSGCLSHYFSNGSILFTAPGEASDTTVTASVLGGGCEVEFEIIEPTAFILENTSLVPPELHLPIPTENWLHIRYYADMYLSPDTVNFYNSRLFEGESDPYPAGYFTLYRHGMQKHNANGPHPMTSSIVPGKGTLCSSSDMVTGVVELNKWMCRRAPTAKTVAYATFNNYLHLFGFVGQCPAARHPLAQS